MPGTTQAADWVHLMGGSRAGLVVVVAMAGTIEEALLARASSKPALDASRPALDARASQARHAAPAAPLGAPAPLRGRARHPPHSTLVPSCRSMPRNAAFQVCSSRNAPHHSRVQACFDASPELQ